MRCFIACLTILGLFVLPAYGTIINVPSDYAGIQDAINISQNGDTALVQPGTYHERLIFEGHEIVLGSPFVINGDSSYISMTVIDGDSMGTVITFEDGESQSALLSGDAPVARRAGVKYKVFLDKFYQ